MAFGKQTKEFLAVHCPNLAPIAEKMETTLGVIKTQNRGRAHVAFDTHGIDIRGGLIVKHIEVVLKVFFKNTE